MSNHLLGKALCIPGLLILFCLKAYSQPAAQFSANPVSGCAPLVVSFTDLSSGNPTQWRWDLGNGTVSFLRNPSVTYFNPGTYAVKLVATNSNGSDSIFKNAFITVYASPQVNFSANSITGCYPLPVQFNDLSQPVSGNLASWQWDFGDGNGSALQNPSHTYTAAGNYNVSVRVVNTVGCSTAVSKPQYIRINDGVRSAFTNTNPASCTAPTTIQFQNQSTGTGVLAYNWDFGDGSGSALQNPSHEYNTPGTFTVRLIVSNAQGCRDTLIRNAAVVIGQNSADFNNSASFCANREIIFQNLSSPQPTGARWYFGDGSFSTSLNPSKTYTAAGTYQVKLVSEFGVCTDSITKTIVVADLPAGNFSANDTISCSAPFLVNFNSSGTGIASYQWSFGDGNISYSAFPSNIYTQPGAYDVRLVVTNSGGCTDTILKRNYIRIQPPVVSIGQPIREGCAPLTLNFSATINSPEPVTQYQWDFGDGQFSNLPQPVHTFDSGVYDIRLIIRTETGCTDTVSYPVWVRAGIKPIAGFYANPRRVCARLPVSFTDTSSGNPTRWLWDFGDGGTSTSQNPEHVYSDTGYFTVQLIVWNNGCPDTVRFENYIYIDPPIAIFSHAFDCGSPFTYRFTDASIGADEWLWNFGDGLQSTEVNPVHTYSNPGSYRVTLTVRNHRTGCDYETSHDIVVVNPEADFSVSAPETCRNTPVTFEAINSDPAHISAYSWSFGDGGSASGRLVSHSYSQAGNYAVQLIITDISGCTDTIIKNSIIRVNGPVADFSAAIQGTCLLNNVQFIDSSRTDGIHAIQSWTWNFGDGNTQTFTSPPFDHAYTSPGNYTVSLSVTDNSGCTDMITKASLLTISRPIAIFATNDTITCPGKQVHFTNASPGPGLSYQWSFGDGQISSEQHPVHIYQAEGSFTVKLKVTDQFGCTDSLVKINYIVVRSPRALFTVSDSVGTCPPLIVNFTNQSQNVSSFTWDFGDGTSSQVLSPSHFYAMPGVYRAKLTVNSIGGCISVKEQTIRVTGPSGSFTYGAIEGCKPLIVTFRATTRNRSSFVWDFNDGQTLTTTDSIVSHTYTVAGKYLPKMILKDQAGCLVPIEGRDTIFVKGVTAAFNTNSNILCDQGSINFTSSSASNEPISGYHWNFGDGSTSSSQDPEHQYQSVGSYYPMLTVTTLSGCRDSVRALIPIKVVKKPEIAISKSPDGCVPLTVSFSGNLINPDSSAITWLWNFGNNRQSNLRVPPSEIYAAAGDFDISLMVTNSSGCADTAVARVRAFGLPLVNAGIDTSVCKGSSVRLNATGASTYTWSPAAGLNCSDCPSPLARPDSSKTYVVTGRSAQGCINKDSVKVEVQFPFNLQHTLVDTVCVGNTLRLRAFGADEYTWTPGDGIVENNVSSITVRPMQSTIYRVIGRDKRHCFADTGYIPVKVYPIPVVEAGPDKTINVGQSIELSPTVSADATEFRWTPSSTIIATNLPSVTVKPRETTTYSITVRNQGGCVSKDELTVYVICNGANVFIPNTFSPNSDGSNDVFFPRGSGVFSIKSFKVFNRWGEMMYSKNDFRANDANAGWDGKYKGQLQNPDVFVYIMEILCDNNTVLTYKGNIALIR